MADPGILGARLLAARRRKGLTQQELASRARLSINTIARLEQGRGTQMGTDALVRLSRLLDVSTDYLLGLSAGEEEDPIAGNREGGELALVAPRA